MRSSDPSSKETVWALYMRTMLLWHSCVRMRWDANRTDAEKAQMEVEFVGKNGQRRKLEVCRAHCSRNVVSHNDPRS